MTYIKENCRYSVASPKASEGVLMFLQEPMNREGERGRKSIKYTYL